MSMLSLPCCRQSNPMLVQQRYIKDLARLPLTILKKKLEKCRTGKADKGDLVILDIREWAVDFYQTSTEIISAGCLPVVLRRVFADKPGEPTLAAVGWVINENINFCLMCTTRFSIFTRKRHCRACGTVACNACCSSFAVIEEYPEFGEQRVCRLCNPRNNKTVHIADNLSCGQSIDETSSLPADQNNSKRGVPLTTQCAAEAAGQRCVTYVLRQSGDKADSNDQQNRGDVAAAPTDVPTEQPTVAPTATPTADPTAVPSAVPSASPTVAPTTDPTAVPTADPTVDPTAVPSTSPTADPTANSTAEPMRLEEDQQWKVNSIVVPSCILGYQIILPYSVEREKELQEGNIDMSFIYVIVDLAKNNFRKTEYKITNFVTGDAWVKLKRGKNKSGVEFRLLRKAELDKFWYALVKGSGITCIASSL